jgi:tetratricopeptide (TPR) repeat protein
MDHHKKCEEERQEIWVKAKDIQDRIKRLEKAALKYPEEMTILSDIAYSYLAIEDIDNAVRTYQKTIDLKDSFEHVWDNELGEAYLFTKNYEKAIEILETSNVISYHQGLFLAFAYLKAGDRKKFKEQFDKWISENLEKSFEFGNYDQYINALFGDEDARFIEDVWDKYYEKYSGMDPYKLYCELYKQNYIRPMFDEEDFEDDDFEIPAKLNRAQFEALSSEYCYLDRRMMFSIDEMTEEEKDRYFGLKDLLFADIVIG